MDDGLLYCRGFLVASSPPRLVPPGYERRSRHLYVDARAGFAESGDVDADWVAIIGVVVDTSTPGRSMADIARDLREQLATGEPALLAMTDRLAGRFVILFKHRDQPLRIVGDACGTRPVAYASRGGMAAMHAKLVADNLCGAPVEPLPNPFMGGYPGRATPYDGVRLLTPNTVLTLETGTVARFYPREPIQRRTVADVTEEIESRLGSCLRELADRSPLVMSLTAGRDSRATLTAVTGSHVPIEAFTYVTDDPSTHDDARRAGEIAADLGFAHTVIAADGPTSDVRASFEAALAANSYGRHGYLVYQRVFDHYRGREVLHIRSNLVEIGRAFWSGYEVNVRSIDGIVSLYSRFQKNPLTPEEWRLLRSQFLDFRVATDFNAASRLGIDPRQLLYWEHRMGCWLSQVLIEGDPAFETVNPWNCRSILQALLSVSWAEQRRGAVPRQMIARAGLDRWPFS